MMSKQAESNLKMRTLLPWLLVIAAHMALVLVAITIYWCALPDGDGEQGDRIVPTITLVDASWSQSHGCIICVGGGPRPRGRWTTICVLRRPMRSRDLIKPLSVSDSLAISDTWGRDVALPADVTNPFRNDGFFPPSDPWRNGVITCSFGPRPSPGRDLVVEFDPFVASQVILPGLQSVRDVIRGQCCGTWIFAGDEWTMRMLVR